MTLDKVNEMLAEAAELKREITIITAETEADIAAMRKVADEELNPLKVQLEALEARITEYAENHRHILFDDSGPRSRTLTGGSFGFRKSVALGLLDGWDWKQAAAALKKEWPELIRVKEEINKPAVLNVYDDRLRKFGLLKEEKDMFWYKTA